MKIKYRPEIDGLRAIAVGAVILYHAQVTIKGYKFFNGGFIGVDIFFVISGYLITSIILKELVTTGLFSFKNFYQRRIRRILPVLLVVILVSIPFAYLILLPQNLIEFSKLIFYSVGFSSNFFLYFSGQEYNNLNKSLLPFIHSWSLAVEEQYYILFPIVLMISFKYFRKYLIYILIIGFVISLGLANWTSRNNSSMSFYFLHTRIWELLAGSILAYFKIKKGHSIKHKTINILPLVGLILIGHSIFFFNDKMLHPSFYTLYPIIGVCLVIYFSNQDELITKFLSTKLFIWIGLISYSLYLWHYPIFAFYRIYASGVPIFSTLYDKILIVTLLIFFSVISFFCIEKPSRKKEIKFSKLLKLLYFKLFIIIVFVFFSFYSKGFEFRIPNNLKDNLKNKMSYINEYNPIFRDCFVRFNYKTDEFCRDTKFKKNIYIVGDSRSGYLLEDLKNKVNDKNFNLNIFSVAGGIINFSDKPLHNFIIRNLLKIENSIIIISGAYNHPAEDFNFLLKIDEFNNLFEELKKNNNKIIFIQPLPVPDYHPYSFSQASMRLIDMIKKENLRDIKFNKKDYYLSLKYYFSFKNKIQEKFKNVNFLKIEDLFCDLQFCYVIKDGYILFNDTAHPSGFSAKLINDLIMKEIEKIELKSN